MLIRFRFADSYATSVTRAERITKLGYAIYMLRFFIAASVSLFGLLLAGSCGGDEQTTEEIIRSKIGDQDASLGFTAIVPEYLPESCLDNPRANATELDELHILLYSTTEDEPGFSTDFPSVGIHEELASGPVRFPDDAPIRYIGDQPFAVFDSVSADALATLQYRTKFGTVVTTVLVMWDATGDASFEFTPEMQDVADKIVESMVDNARKLGIPAPPDASV